MLVALGSLCAGAALAWHHPLWPMAVLAVFSIWCLIAAWRPGLWLFVVPALLPLLNFSSWTGWLVFEEFDILLLGALAGAYGPLAWSPPRGRETKTPFSTWRSTALLGLFGLAGLLALLRGLADAGGFAFDWFAGYTDALNSLRVFKSLGFALLFVPLLQRELKQSGQLAHQRFAGGMVAGLTVVTLAVLWERAAFPGWLDFSVPYRTVALFWEMHVGGAAIDGYLALATPFLVWALLAARRPLFWAAAAVLTLLTAYACLTTFSRGVYLAVAGPLLLLGLLLRAQKTNFNARDSFCPAWRRYRPEGWRARASLALMLALAAEVAAVLGAGSFMMDRLASADRDFGSRVEHWRRGLDLLDGPTDWLLGKGLGRLPADYAAHVPQGEFSGEVKWREEQKPGQAANAFVTVRGPPTLKRLGGQYALTQRVVNVSQADHRVSLDVRVQHTADVYVELCERHLLYDGPCQLASIRVLPGKNDWQNMVLPLKGQTLAGGPWYAPRLSMLSLSVVNAGGAADFDNVSLMGAYPAQPLENGDFSGGMAHWFPLAQSYFVPWHIDNLFLELLIERGLVGLLLFAALMAYALWHLVFGRARASALAPYLAASLCGALLVGLVSSLMDVPRVAFLFCLLALVSAQAAREVD
ncbi:O-antigen ligase family protein [Rhodoferax ferrireducens]|uniref:O-antigen ligase family protein n=1 Tax=Rhodoferax ferrireducens TaxID=192843 RepID=UPI00298E5CF9|nr:O-antigen ligase family protein [Rhodoferax ferrireducens]WPC67672.1 O-antigen ligase family protein [Rhodoferax ferrireducens]